MRADAKTVIAEHLDNAAIPSLPLIVRICHPRQFFAKLRKNGHASVHCRELLSSDLMGGRTIFGRLFGQSHQLRDVIETKPQFPRMAQEGYEAFSWCAVSPANPRQDRAMASDFEELHLAVKLLPTR
jgi:hypothetical protein